VVMHAGAKDIMGGSAVVFLFMSNTTLIAPRTAPT
jgi:hypothetical protein